MILRGWRQLICAGAFALGTCSIACAQAAAMPAANPSQTEKKNAQELLQAMVSALGGDAWLARKTWVIEGKMARFYKGQAEASAPSFEEYGRTKPFAERFVLVSHYGAIVAKDHRDVAKVWSSEGGWEITYKGTTPLSAKEVADFERAREHSLETVVQDWLSEKNVEVRYQGSKLAESALVDEIDIDRESGDAVIVLLDAQTHLPVSVSWRSRDAEFGDWDTDAVEFADYHQVQQVMTPYSVTHSHNGDTLAQQFVTRVVYNVALGDEVFAPKPWVAKKGK